MKRFEGSVLVTYKFSAESVDAGWDMMENLDFPPADDDMYVAKAQVIRVFDLDELGPGEVSDNA